MKRGIARYIRCGGRGKPVWENGKLGTKPWLGMTQKGCAPANILEFIQNIFVCRKMESSHSLWKFSILLKENFLSVKVQLLTKLSLSPKTAICCHKKQSPTKLPHSMKHITYCPPKSNPAFSKALTNPYAVKPASRIGSKYSELYGTK